MTRYLVPPRDICCEFFAKNMGRNIANNISKNLSIKYSQKLLNHAQESATDVFKTDSKKAIQKTPETTGDLIGNKIADRIRKVSKTSPQNDSVTNEENIGLDSEIHKEIYISPEERQKIIEDLRLI